MVKTNLAGWWTTKLPRKPSSVKWRCWNRRWLAARLPLRGNTFQKPPWKSGGGLSPSTWLVNLHSLRILFWCFCLNASGTSKFDLPTIDRGFYQTVSCSSKYRVFWIESSNLPNEAKDRRCQETLPHQPEETPQAPHKFFGSLNHLNIDSTCPVNNAASVVPRKAGYLSKDRALLCWEGCERYVQDSCFDFLSLMGGLV